MKVSIKNYQALKNVELDFPKGKMVGIIGATNSGKSSIIRAIESAINNKEGSSFINYDADETEVRIQTEDNDILWVKSKKAGKSYYDINGEKYTKIGKNQLDVVSDLLNMKELEIIGEKHRLNFWKQMKEPFLINRTPQQLFDFISKSKEQELVSDYQDEKNALGKSIDSDVKDYNSKIDYIKQQLSKDQERLEELKIIDEIDLNLLNKRIEFSNNLQQKIDKVLTTEKDYDTISNRLVSNRLRLNSLSMIDEIPELIETTKKIGQSITRHELAKLGLERVKQSLEANSKNLEHHTVQLDKYLTAIEQLNKLNSELKETNRLLSKYYLVSDVIESLSKQVTKSNGLLKDVEKKLQDFDTCPLCGNPLSTHNH